MYWSRKSVDTPLEAWGPPWTTSTMTDLPPKMRGVRKTKNMSYTKTQASRTVATFRLGRRMTDRNDMHMHMPMKFWEERIEPQIRLKRKYHDIKILQLENLQNPRVVRKPFQEPPDTDGCGEEEGSHF